jgi:hypothetical protein
MKTKLKPTAIDPTNLRKGDVVTGIDTKFDRSYLGEKLTVELVCLPFVIVWCKWDHEDEPKLKKISLLEHELGSMPEEFYEVT